MIAEDGSYQSEWSRGFDFVEPDVVHRFKPEYGKTGIECMYRVPTGAPFVVRLMDGDNVVQELSSDDGSSVLLQSGKLHEEIESELVDMTPTREERKRVEAFLSDLIAGKPLDDHYVEQPEIAVRGLAARQLAYELKQRDSVDLDSAQKRLVVVETEDDGEDGPRLIRYAWLVLAGEGDGETRVRMTFASGDSPDRRIQKLELFSEEMTQRLSQADADSPFQAFAIQQVRDFYDGKFQSLVDEFRGTDENAKITIDDLRDLRDTMSYYRHPIAPSSIQLKEIRPESKEGDFSKVHFDYSVQLPTGRTDKTVVTLIYTTSPRRFLAELDGLNLEKMVDADQASNGGVVPAPQFQDAAACLQGLLQKRGDATTKSLDRSVGKWVDVDVLNREFQHLHRRLDNIAPDWKRGISADDESSTIRKPDLVNWDDGRVAEMRWSLTPAANSESKDASPPEIIVPFTLHGPAGIRVETEEPRLL
ncbi:MAG: hypothetical protein AAFP69_22580, partial [Planctomycetota bacterium]